MAEPAENKAAGSNMGLYLGLGLALVVLAGGWFFFAGGRKRREYTGAITCLRGSSVFKFQKFKEYWARRLTSHVAGGGWGGIAEGDPEQARKEVLWVWDRFLTGDKEIGGGDPNDPCGDILQDFESFIWPKIKRRENVDQRGFAKGLL